MIIQNFFYSISPILIAIIAFILIFIALKKLNVPGSDITLAILSLLISFIFFSSKRVANYTISLIPIITVLIIISFLVLLVIAFTAKDIGTFSKPLAWIGFILAILISLGFAFNQFPVLNHMLPGTSDAYLTNEMEDFKDFIYSNTFRDTFIFVISIVIVLFFILKK